MDKAGFVMQDDILLRVETEAEEVVVPEGVREIAGISFGERYYDLSRDSYALREIPGAFSYSRTLRRVSLPSSLRRIGPRAFADCGMLDTVLFSGGLADIGEEAFINCVSLEKLDLPDTVTVIGSRAFSGCKKLRRLSVPAGTQAIGQAAFAYCSSLSALEIPEGVASWGKELCRGCLSLEELLFPEKIPLKVFSGCKWYHRKMTEDGRCPVCGEKITLSSGMCMNPSCLTQYGKWER